MDFEVFEDNEFDQFKTFDIQGLAFLVLNVCLSLKIYGYFLVKYFYV